MSSKVKSNHKKTIQGNEEQDMLALLIGAANIVCSIIANWFKPSTLKYGIFGDHLTLVCSLVLLLVQALSTSELS